MNNEVKTLMKKIKSLEECRYNLFLLRQGEADLARWSNDDYADLMYMFSPDMALVDCKKGVMQIIQRNKMLLIIIDFNKMLYSMSICHFHETMTYTWLPLREIDIDLFLPDLRLLATAYVHVDG